VTNGRIYVWQTASSVNQFVRFSFERTIQDFDANSDNPDFPIEWTEALVWNLAARLGVDYDAPPQKMQLVTINAEIMLDDILGFDQEYDSINLQPDLT